MTSLNAANPINLLAVKAMMAMMRKSFLKHTQDVAAEIRYMVEEGIAAGKRVSEQKAAQPHISDLNS
jgi:hypothetical protein